MLEGADPSCNPTETAQVYNNLYICFKLFLKNVEIIYYDSNILQIINYFLIDNDNSN